MTLAPVADDHQLPSPQPAHLPPQPDRITVFTRQHAVSLTALPISWFWYHFLRCPTLYDQIGGGIAMPCSLATKVNEDTVAAINSLEKDLGKTLLALALGVLPLILQSPVIPVFCVDRNCIHNIMYRYVWCASYEAR
jgi:hypothetical protein